MRRPLRPGSCLVSLVTIGFMLSAAASAGAQSLMRGVITDEWHNPLEGATVVAERPEAGLQRTTTTGEDGRFQFTGLNFDDWTLPAVGLAAVEWSLSATLDGYERTRQVVGFRLRGGNQPVNFRLPVVATGGRFGAHTEFEAEGGTPRVRFEADGTFEFEDAGGEGEGTYGLVALAAILVVRDYDGPNDKFMNLLTSKWVEAIDFGSRNGVEEGVDEAQFRRNTNRASR